MNNFISKTRSQGGTFLDNIKKKAKTTKMADLVSKTKKENEDVIVESKSPNKVKAMLKEKQSPMKN